MRPYVSGYINDRTRDYILFKFNFSAKFESYVSWIRDMYHIFETCIIKTADSADQCTT